MILLGYLWQIKFGALCNMANDYNSAKSNASDYIYDTARALLTQLTGEGSTYSTSAYNASASSRTIPASAELQDVDYRFAPELVIQDNASAYTYDASKDSGTSSSGAADRATAHASNKGTEGEYTYPFWGIWSSESATFPWVQLVAKENKQKGASARSAFIDQGGAATLATFKLLLQDKDFGWAASHTWEAYKGWSAPLNEALSKLYAGGTKFLDFVKDVGSGAFTDNATIKQALTTLEDPTYVRVDQSMVYANTANRRISFSFEFARPPVANSSKIMWDIIKELERLSCSKSGGAVTFSPPSIWNVSIMAPGGASVWGLNFCALTDVKTGIIGPWKGGYPSKVDISLDFVHLPPVFEDNGWWTNGGGGMPAAQ